MRLLRWIVLSSVLLSGGALAQNFPTRPITLVFGLPAGGAVDMVARLYGELVAAQLGQPIVVESRPGGSGIIAANSVAQAAPDGHTIMIALGGTHTITPWLQQMPFDPIGGFEPITLLFSFPTLLAVPAESSIRSVADLVAQAKANPGKLNFG